MSNKAKAGESPMTFKAGGKSSKRSELHAEEKKDDMKPLELHSGPSFYKFALPPPSTCNRPSLQPKPEIQPAVSSKKNAPVHLSVVRAGLCQKRSPLEIKNWIACVLTLDGRDKFTKVSINEKLPSGNDYSQ